MDYYRLIDKDTAVLEKDTGDWWKWYCAAPADWKTVASYVINKSTVIITVYYGKNEAMLDHGKSPLLWRTELRQGDNCEVIWSYATRADAEREHPRAVRNELYRRGEIGVKHDRRSKSLTGRLRRVLKHIVKAM
jgi:hypothetical protein